MWSYSNPLIKCIPDKIYLKMISYRLLGQGLNLTHPKTYNEKLNYLKLHDRNPLYTKLVDKYEVKKYIKEKLGEHYVVPNYGVRDRFDDIDFDKLPNSFVLKCTHNSGGLLMVKDKNELNKLEAKQDFDKWLAKIHFYQFREWAYKNVKPRIIAEKYLSDGNSDGIIDYKFFCFNGEPKMMYISNDHGNNPHTDFFDMDYNQIDVQLRDSKSLIPPKKPIMFDEMKKIAGCLSKRIPHLRVDLFCVKNHIYIGELTLYTWGGFCIFKPKEYDRILGDWLKLPNEK